MTASRRDFLKDNFYAATALGSAMALGTGPVVAQEAKAAVINAGSAGQVIDMPEWTPSPPFQRSEHQQRIHRLKQAMQQEKLDAVLIYSQHSMYYLFGYDVMSGAAIAYQTVIVPLDGEPVALVRNTMVDRVSQSPFLNDVRHYTESFSSDSVRMTTEILAEKHLLQGKRIGIETRSLTLNAHDYEVVRQGVDGKGGQLVDVSAMVAGLRMRKSAAELDYMRQAGRLLDVMLEAAYAAMKPGVRECDVEAEALRAVYSAGGDDMAQPLYIVPAIWSVSHISQPFTRRKLGRGEPFILEGGACYNRYHAVGGYPAICGTEPDKGLLQAFAKARQTVDAGREVLRAGLAVSDLARTMMVHEQKAQEGFHGGYSIGIGYRYLWHEHPIIRTSDKHILEAGMTFSLFGMGLSDDSKYFLFLAEPVIVTETGFEDLSKLPRNELRVVGT